MPSVRQAPKVADNFHVQNGQKWRHYYKSTFGAILNMKIASHVTRVDKTSHQASILRNTCPVPGNVAQLP